MERVYVQCNPVIRHFRTDVSPRALLTRLHRSLQIPKCDVHLCILRNINFLSVLDQLSRH